MLRSLILFLLSVHSWHQFFIVIVFAFGGMCHIYCMESGEFQISHSFFLRWLILIRFLKCNLRKDIICSLMQKWSHVLCTLNSKVCKAYLSSWRWKSVHLWSSWFCPDISDTSNHWVDVLVICSKMSGSWATSFSYIARMKNLCVLIQQPWNLLLYDSQLHCYIYISHMLSSVFSVCPIIIIHTWYMNNLYGISISHELWSYSDSLHQSVCTSATSHLCVCIIL